MYPFILGAVCLGLAVMSAGFVAYGFRYHTPNDVITWLLALLATSGTIVMYVMAFMMFFS